MQDVMDAEIVRSSNNAMMPIQPPVAPVQRVSTGYTTAMQVQKPRSLPDVMRRLEQEAQLSGDAFFYSWGTDKNKVEGPSIKLANAAVRCYGNCAIEMAPLQETHDAWIFTAMFIDLETGFTLPRQFRQSKKWVVFGKFDDARKDDIRFQIGQSKAIRNLVCNALPSGLIDRALEVAKDNARKKLADFIAKIDKEKGAGQGLVHAIDLVIRNFAKEGIKEERLLLKLEIADRKAIDTDRLLILNGDLGAIRSGEVHAEELYPLAKTDVLADKLEMGKKADAAKEETPKAEAPKEEPKAEKKKSGKSEQTHIPGVDEDLDAQAR